LGLGNNYIDASPNFNPYLEDIVQISCGEEYTLCLNNQGQVCSFGRNTIGQLSFSNDYLIDTPILLDSMKNIIQISCKSQHALCLNKDGKVWAFGSNRYSELGLKDHNMAKPEIISS
jgi:alpha-tubulin suppressor-like RCC1 family protein